MDISSIDDIRLLVDTFYGKVRKDALIGPIFIAAIGDDWPSHLDKMVRFWQTVLLGEHTYYGSPFPPHGRMPLEQKHFETWLRLWNATVDELFGGEQDGEGEQEGERDGDGEGDGERNKSAEAKWRANKMAGMFLSKITYYRNNPAKPIL